VGKTSITGEKVSTLSLPHGDGYATRSETTKPVCRQAGIAMTLPPVIEFLLLVVQTDLKFQWNGFGWRGGVLE